MKKLKAGIVGATGLVGQQFVAALQDHPWFSIERLAASERSAGQAYGSALKDPRTGATRWYCEGFPKREVLELQVEDASKMDCSGLDVLFSGVEAEVALKLEPEYARTTPVISTAAAFRYEEDTPILIPAVNDQHAEILRRQQERRGWRGFIAPMANCTTTGLAITLKPIQDAFGIERVIMASMQSVSGAGRSPGVLALDIIDNVIPFIPREEEKVQAETLKILGKYEDGKIVAADMKVSCTCTRVNVSEGHTEAVFVSTRKGCGVEDVKDAFRKFNEQHAKSKLPSSPREMIVLAEDPFRPQPKLDRDNHGGMATTVGRLRRDDALDRGIKYVLVSHNTKIGASKGAVMVAELLVEKGYIG
ncbi:MAG: aspartate-semialdehyde dehydrogenase [Candidatus Brockarchaeota archaeon]|nr:aspartate-semialdehyde dehydrogenase [Candidatus Brockarchaeota archaeon]